MRLADISELGEAPDAGAEEVLRPGDVAGLYAVHPSADDWGDGYEPFEAMVVDVPSPGCYLGETRDGSRFEFTQRNVAAVRPQLGGVFDWVKRAVKGLVPPTPGMLPALPPEERPQLPAPAAPTGPKPPAPSFFDWFKPKTTLPAVRPEESTLPAAAEPAKKPGIFDWFRPKRYEGPKDVAVRPEGVITPATKAPSMFAAIDEKPTILKQIEEAASSMTVAPPSGPLIPTPEIFKHIQASPEEEADLAKAQQLQLWQTLFPEPSEGRTPDVPLSEMFKPFEPDEVMAPPAERGAPPPGAVFSEETLPPVAPENLKFLPLPSRNDLLPTPLDVARGFMTRYQPIDDLWELLRQVRQDPAFQKEVQKGVDGRGPGARFMFETLGMCEGNPDAFQALASFLGVPWSAVVERGRPEVEVDDRGREYFRLTDYTRINEDIVFPASELIYQAFELVKPKDLPGIFTLEWGGHKDHSCQLVISYAEGSPLAPEPGAAPPTEEVPPTQERSLGEIVPEAAMQDVTDVMNQFLRNDIDELEAIRRMQFVLEPHREALLAKNTVPDFLAIWLVSSAKGMKGQ